MNPVRAALGRLICAANDIAIEDLAAASGLDLDVARYHVQVLIACGLVELASDG